MTETTPPFVRQLRLGNVGPDVLAVARALVRWAGVVPDGLALDEHMGPVKVTLLERFQRAQRLAVDGIYGQATHTKLAPYFDEYGGWLLAQEAKILAGAYRNPFRDVAGLTFLGYDQGADFGGSGPVYAAGPGIVTVATQKSGWPGGGAVAYTFTAGEAKGKSVYLAEHIQIRVAVGRPVNSVTVIADLELGYPDCETGWAQADSDNPMSQPVPRPNAPTYFGVNMGAFLRSLGETRCPPSNGGQDTPLPAGWPSWELV